MVYKSGTEELVGQGLLFIVKQLLYSLLNSKENDWWLKLVIQATSSVWIINSRDGRWNYVDWDDMERYGRKFYLTFSV